MGCQSAPDRVCMHRPHKVGPQLTTGRAFHPPLFHEVGNTYRFCRQYLVVETTPQPGSAHRDFPATVIAVNKNEFPVVIMVQLTGVEQTKHSKQTQVINCAGKFRWEEDEIR